MNSNILNVLLNLISVYVIKIIYINVLQKKKITNAFVKINFLKNVWFQKKNILVVVMRMVHKIVNLNQNFILVFVIHNNIIIVEEELWITFVVVDLILENVNLLMIMNANAN